MKDPILGENIHQLLLSQGIETPMRIGTAPNKETVRNCYHQIMVELGLNTDDESLRDTPRRVAKMYCEEIFAGLNYDNFPDCAAVSNTMQYDELLTTRCSVISMCEHHAVAFQGTALIGYLPATKILGLSKFNRVVDFFCRRPQIQERLTAQIHTALCHILSTDDVAVVVQAEHLCVRMRGIRDHNSQTTTSKLSGRFRTVDALRSEFLALSRSL